LQARGVAYEFVDFRAHPPPAASVSTWVRVLGSKAMKNVSGGSYRALGPEREAWTEVQWSAAFAADPMLIKRPLVTVGERAVCAGWAGSDDELAAMLTGRSA
jgi:arsenate reductase